MKYLMKAKILTREISKEIKVLPDKKRHFTFIFDNNKLVSVGTNNYLSSNKFVRYLGYHNKKIHSEVASIYKFRRELDKLKGLILVNTRIDPFGVFSMSKPCSICQEWINLIGFKRIYYTDWNGEWIKL